MTSLNIVYNLNPFYFVEVGFVLQFLFVSKNCL